ncbi:VanZ family protein [Candidatus Pacearchaeota archaeon]|nr:VanZ family protein [Candidatus Pacearchaeota archaeon]
MITFFEKHNKLSWAITIIIAITIFILSSKTFEGGYATVNINAIFYHFFAFFFLGAFLLISLLKGKKDYSLLLLGIAITIIYGITDELHQFFVPGRYCTLFDAATDSIGVLFAGAIYSVRVRFKK